MVKADIKIRELVDKVQRGELKLPEMQRKYVWPATRVRDLLDSLYRKYPSGTILVWETDEDITDRNLAIKATKSPTTSQKLLLLDGQQRVTSLSAILSGEPIQVKNKDKPIEILFNLEHPEGPPTELIEVDEKDVPEDFEENEDEESARVDIQQELKKRTFVVSTKMLKNNPLWVSVSDVFKKSESQILKPLGINSDDSKWEKYSKRLQELKKIEEYEYVMQILDKKMSYEEVTEIFVRVNSLGIKLRGSDLALAQITSRWKGFMGQLENFSSEFDKDDGEYLLNSGLLVKTLVSFATHQSKFKTVGKLSLKQLESSWELAKNGIRFAVNFIKTNARVDRLDYLSSPFLIIPIAVYAINNKENLSNENEKLLLKWLFYAHMRGHYSLGSSESILDADLSSLFNKNNLEYLNNILLNQVKRFEVISDDLKNRGTSGPFFSMLYLILKEGGAKDWFTGLPLSNKHIGKSHSLQYHHIFPQSLLKEKGFDRKEINEIANMAFIGGKTNRTITNKEPKIYFEDIIQKKGEGALTSQLITMNKEYWEINNFLIFTQKRRELIAEEINKFMKKLE
ncbi:MAG: DUF262 domain-containing protein [Nanoarchaeota archaeon]